MVLSNKTDPATLQKLRKKVKQEKQATNNQTPSTVLTNNKTTSRTNYGSAPSLSNKSDPDALRRLQRKVSEGKAERAKTTTSLSKAKNTPNRTSEQILDSAGYYGEKLGRGIIDGLEGITDFAWSIPLSLGWAVSSGFGFFDNSVENWFEKQYNNINQDDITDYFGSAEERYDAAPDWVKDSGWLPESIGNIVPFAVETYFSGGTNMVDDLAAAGGSVVDDVAKAGTTLWDDVVKAGKNAVDDVAKTVSNPKKLLTNPDVHFGMSAGGSAIEEAIKPTYKVVGLPDGTMEEVKVREGTNPFIATAYGTAAGALEVITEKLFGSGYAGLGDDFGKAALSASKSTKATNNTLLKKIWNHPVTKKIINLGTEGLEEDIVEFADPILQRAIGVDANAEWATWSDYVESGTHGVILAIVMNAVGIPIDIHNKSKAISSLNNSTEVLNGLVQDDTLKLQPLPNNATEEQIVARQKEISAVALAFDNAVKKSVQNEQATASNAPEQAAMDVVANRNATQAENTQPISKVSTTDDSLPTQAVDYLKTPKNAQRNATKGITLAERLEAQSKNNETLEVADVKKATGFGDEGSKLVTRLANREGVTFSQAKGAVETAYRLGLTDVKTKKVRFDNSLQKRAFDAGKIDIDVQNRAKLAESKNASVYETGFTENEYSAKLTADEREMFTTMSKDLKMDISFVDKIVAFYVNGKAKEANASHLDGKMEVSSTSQKPMVAIATHEGGHRMSQLDPESFNVLMSYLYETSDQNARRLKVDDKGVSVFDQVRSEYGDNNDSMNTRDYVEEIAVSRLETIFSSAEEFNKWRAELDLNPQAKSAWQKFIEIIKKVLEDMWAAVTHSKMSLEAKRQAQTELELFENAYRGAIKAAETRANEVQTKNADTNSAKNLEIRTNEDYNSKGRINGDDLSNESIDAGGKNTERYSVTPKLSESGELNESTNSSRMEERGTNQNNDSVWQRSDDSKEVYNSLGSSKKSLRRRQNSGYRFIDWSRIFGDIDVYEQAEKEYAYGILREISQLTVSSIDQQGRKVSDEQKEYFKGTVAKNSKGELIPLYHATDGDFTVFETGDFAYHIGDLAQAMDMDKKYIKEVYIKLNNPVFIEYDAGVWTGVEVADALKEQGIITKAEYDKLSKLEGFDDNDSNSVANKAIKELLEKKHYDGIVYRNDHETRGLSFMVFDSNQIKYTSNKKPTSDSDIRFSLKKPVEETKNLIAVHNLSPAKLLKTLRLGGLPMPSIAITRAKDGYNNFGDISLVFNKDTIDPQFMRSNKVYSGDAWTPTYPQVAYKVNEKAQEQIRKKINGLVPKNIQDDLGGLHLDVYNIEDDLNRHGDMSTSYRYNYAMKYAFLKDNNVSIELPTKEEPFYRYGEVSNDAVAAFAHKLVDGLKTANSLLEQHSSKLMEDTELLNSIATVLNEEVMATTDKNSVDYQKLAENPLFKPEEIDLSTVLGMLEAARKYFHSNGKVESRVDYQNAKGKIDDYFDSHSLEPEYEYWLKKLFSDIVAKEGIRNNRDLFTPSGNRRSFEALHYEHNLENVIKAMKEQGDTGVGAFGGGNILGAATREYGSIADIKADAQNRMEQLPESQHDEIRKGFTDRLFELAYSLPIHKDRFSAVDDAANMLIEAVSKYKTKSGMANYLRKESQGWANYNDYIVDDLIELVNDIRQMPVSYFEAKPQRAVGFDEIKAVIMPEQSSYEDDLSELKVELEKINIPILEYEYGDNNSRIKALNSLEDVKFSLKGGTDVSPKRTAEYLDAVEAVQKGKKGASERLAKYVDSGMIRTEEYEKLIKKYGAINAGERPSRDIQVPKKTAKDKKVSQTVRTILEAKATPDEAVPTIEKMVEDGVFSYDAYTDKQAINDAESYIKEYGWEKSLADWFKSVAKGEVSKELTAMGWALYNNAANIAATTTSETERRTAIITSLNLLDAMVRHQRSAAQALQATRILKKLSPETQLYGVQKSVSALQNELTDRYGDKAPDLKIDEELAEQFLNAKTPEERAEVEREIYKDIGRQMPSRFIDKWNAWRYLAMLGNVHTHGRNILGNAFFAPVVIAKDLTATAIESAVNRVSSKKMVRGKALITGNKADRALLKAAWGDYGNVADMISNGGKYNDFAMANQQIEAGRQIFKFKPLEWARKKNSQLLEVEDVWFSKPHYAYAMAQYCKANNITAEQIKRGKAIAPAREYAIKEAQKATYRDTNAFSQMVSEWGRNNKNEKSVVKKAFNAVIEGELPFRKTPANILVRGTEYSPLGLLKGLSYDLMQVSKGKMTATEAIDNISAGLTGTGLLALGVYLAAQGLIRGHGEDEEDEKKFKEMMGHQAYSLELPNGQSITLDWLAPEALPFFVGVNIWEATRGTDEKVNLSTILKSLSGITEPMLEMSCLQSLNNLFESIRYASSNDTSGLTSILSSAATSYLMQGLPTLFGQMERTGEENRMTTYTEKNDFLTDNMQYTLGKASAKIPFVDYHQIPYIDAWGRKEASGMALKRGFNNFLNPAYTSTIETSDMEEELLRLYEETGEDGVFPERADKYFIVNGVRKDLTAEEYVRYATLKGEKSYKLVSDLVKSKAYKNLSDGDKAKAVRDAYDYANQKAKQAISRYKPDTWVNKADEFGSNVGNYISFKTEVSGTKEDNGGKISKQEVADIILDAAQNDDETWKMYLSMYDSEKDMYAYNEGIEGETYMYFLEALNDVDEPTKSGKYGTYTQKEAYRAIMQLEDLSQKEKAILWQSVNTSWKSSNNPFR